MSGNKARGAVPEKQTYESVVLDFLDKEMAAVRPADRRQEHSQDLDVLVSDLLKQVISEADQVDTRPANYNESNAMLAEFPPVELGPHEMQPPEATDAASPSTPASPLARESEPAVIEAQQDMEFAALEAESEMDPASLEAQSEMGFAAQAAEPEPEPDPAADAQKPTAPFMITTKVSSNKPALAVAAACLLAAIGFGGYRLLGGSGKSPANLSSEPAVTDSATAPAGPSTAAPAPTGADPAPEQPASGRNVVAALPPATIKAESSVPAVAGDPVPAPPRDERPNLLHGTDQIAAARRNPIDGMIPTSAPGKAAPAAPRAPQPAQTQTTAATAAPQVSGTVVPAVPILQVSPKYPAIAVKTRTSAVVELDVVIDANGRVIEAFPVSGPTMFHKEATDAAMKWRYQPASIGGSNVQSQTRIIMKFNLR
jgi:TonB family protein